MGKDRLFIIFITLLAVLLGILAVSMPMDWLGPVMFFSRFFEVMIPVLAVGALLKYLWCCPKK